MSYKITSKLLREFVKESLNEMLQGAESLTPYPREISYDTAFGPQAPTLFQSRGYQGVQYDGTPMSFVLNALGAPQSSYDLYGNFFGPNGFFDFGGIFGTRASPFGRNIGAIGSAGVGTVGAVLGPRNAANIGQGYWSNLRSAFSGGLAIRRESLDPSEMIQNTAAATEPLLVQEPVVQTPEPPSTAPPPAIQQQAQPAIGDDQVISSLSRDVEKILSDYNEIKSAQTAEEAIHAWQRATGFGNSSRSAVQQAQLVDTPEGSEVYLERLRSFISDDLAPVYYSNLISPVLDGFLSPTPTVSASARARAVSILEDALGSIRL